MKGYVFTITTFMIFLGLIAYFSSYTELARQRTTMVNEQMAGERIWRTWLSTASGVPNLVNVSVAKTYGAVEINDSLPATKNIGKLLNKWQNFTRIYANDPSMVSRFEDMSGNEILLGDSMATIRILPVGINYTWPDWNKQECTIKTDNAGFAYIDHIEMKLNVSPLLRNPDIIKWTPLKECKAGTTHCLVFNLTITDGNSTWVSPYDATMLDADQESTLSAMLAQPPSNFWIKVSVGKLPKVVTINMQNANTSLNTKIVLNTADFYTDFLAKLNITSPFGQKIKTLGLNVWKNQD